jgi:hypothetical protein
MVCLWPSTAVGFTYLYRVVCRLAPNKGTNYAPASFLVVTWMSTASGMVRQSTQRCMPVPQHLFSLVSRLLLRVYLVTRALLVLVVYQPKDSRVKSSAPTHVHGPVEETTSYSFRSSLTPSSELGLCANNWVLAVTGAAMERLLEGYRNGGGMILDLGLMFDRAALSQPLVLKHCPKPTMGSSWIYICQVCLCVHVRRCCLYTRVCSFI